MVKTNLNKYNVIIVSKVFFTRISGMYPIKKCLRKMWYWN